MVFAFLFWTTIHWSLFFARQMQHERGAAITCAVRMLAWMADGFAMLRIASAMTEHTRARSGDGMTTLREWCHNHESRVKPIADCRLPRPQICPRGGRQESRVRDRIAYFPSGSGNPGNSRLTWPILPPARAAFFTIESRRRVQCAPLSFCDH